ncbi:tetratricopeptide repeat protein [Asaia bogorensis]|uniref:tetratricopeptide repeat protein n=1 Tax=Asaia bogorensis TaxID=91915 RepID=UPI002865E982|nr:tetratricopeptide repeat protein [Asaia bogorensis]MDR6183567.1 tetratricopeptide (TPR) repeat protein [Asaia bogorensis NBRC 16594]
MPLIYSDEHIQVFFRPGQSDVTYIFFSELTFQANGRNFWGEHLAERLDLNCVAFVATGPQWYPEKSMRRAIAAAMPFLVDRFTLSYAASMGAYAALRYAELLDANITLAVAPQWSIDPAKAPYEPRFTRYFAPHLHGAMEIRSNSGYSTLRNKIYLVSDPVDPPDYAHTKAIMAALPHAELIPVHYIGHPAIFAFSGSATMSKIFAAMIDGNHHDVRTVLRRQKKDKLPYLLGLLSALIIRQHPRWVKSLIGRLQAEGVNVPSHMYELALDAKAMGDHEKVVAICKEIVRIHPEHIEAYHRIAEASRKTGSVSQGVSYLQRAIALFSKECHLYGHMGIALQEAGQYHEAINAFDKALSLNADLADLVARRERCVAEISPCCV